MDIRHAVGVRSGVPAEALADLPGYRNSACFTARERAALEFSERISRPKARSEFRKALTRRCIGNLRPTNRAEIV